MIETAVIALIFLAFVIFAARRLMTYLHILQQDDYDSLRLFKWMFEYKVIDKKLTFCLILIGLLPFAFPAPAFWGHFLVFACFALFAYAEKDPRKRSKKKLVLTARARRIFIPALIVSVTGGAAAVFFDTPWVWIAAVQAIPFALMLANFMLKPVENSIQQKFWNEAQSKLRVLRPKIIAVTGSYGKTSVKHIIGHILKTQAPTLITPGSTNTAMGTARIIREDLDERHKYLVVEMGAYGPGSISRLCALTPPDIGIITSIGHAHYERFKTLDTVAQAKFELAESVVGRGGMMIVHEKTLDFPYSKQLAKSRSGHFIVCHEPLEGSHARKTAKAKAKPVPKEHVQLDNITQTKNGLKIKLSHEGKSHVLDVPLYGTHHGHNVALAFAAARQLGIEPEAIKTALLSLKQVEHRLEVKRQPDGTTLIDDAFNSNPRGFRAALDLLAVMDTGEDGRRILITPGMVEMGGTHDDVHDKIGRTAGKICDIALVVNPKRIPTFIKGFKAAGKSKTLLEFPRFTDAAVWIAENKEKGDVILIENDLPDLYERVPKI